MHQGVKLFFHPLATTPSVDILIGETTAQDLALDLGPPLRVHYKDDDRMNIHSAPGTSASNCDSSCISPHIPRHLVTQLSFTDFYNYLQHGIDVLLDGSTHIVKKIILHTNIVRDMYFGGYSHLNTIAWFPSVSTIQALQLGDRRSAGG